VKAAVGQMGARGLDEGGNCLPCHQPTATVSDFAGRK
jgi:hypothetical protein